MRSNKKFYAHRNVWKSIVDQLTHEKAVWYFAECFPNSWSLDPIEASKSYSS